MSRKLIGQILRSMGKMTAIDVEEILAEQAVSKRRFGEIAIDWGLCEPEHVHDAWCSQLMDGRGQVNLETAPIDPYAVLRIPVDALHRLGILPIQVMGNEMVIAASRSLKPMEVFEVIQLAGRPVRFVHADEKEIARMIEQYYPVEVAA